MNRKKGVKSMVTLVLFLIVVLAAVFAGIIIERNTPSKEWMSTEEYFGIHDGDAIVIYNHERLEEPVIVENGRVYMTFEFVREHLNKRFYHDIWNDDILYTTKDAVLTFVADSNTYTDSRQNSYDGEYPVVKKKEGALYLALDFVGKYADFNYRYYENPSRIMIWDIYETREYVSADKDTQMRLEMDIKSDIIRNVAAGETFEVLEGGGNGFKELRSEDGFTGYVQEKYLTDSFSRTEVSSFVPEEQPESIHFSTKINLTWHSLGAAAGGAKVTEALQDTRGINVISPTWYSITSNDGEVSSHANESYVAKCHELGIMVWPLIDDFNTGLDGVELYSRRETREKLIDRIISDSKTYGFDGINIDFEKVTADSAVHYLQFIRELSLACEEEKLVLSVDNYVPKDYNLHYDRTEQGIWADYIIVMGYDEHWAGSDAGSVASIGFVEEGIVETLREVPAGKVINAMPFYTRIWLETPNADGTVTTTSRAVGMETAYKTIKESGYPAIWDETCAQYYCAYDYAEGNSVVKIWLEDEKSIEEKMKLFKQYDLAGVASWRLGFETSGTWDVILKYLQ